MSQYYQMWHVSQSQAFGIVDQNIIDISGTA